MKNYTVVSCHESRVIDSTKIYARFEIGKFPSGQAVTVANTLRRALLSQVPGVAITLVHIENVFHEYDTISGVQECALDIILNLKKLVFKSELDIFGPQPGFVRINGPAILRAGDLKLPFFVSCVNPEQYIATITETGQFYMTFLVNCGKNYLNHTPDSKAYLARVFILNEVEYQHNFDQGYENLHQNEPNSDPNQENVSSLSFANWKNTKLNLTLNRSLRLQQFIRSQLRTNPNTNKQSVPEKQGAPRAFRAKVKSNKKNQTVNTTHLPSSQKSSKKQTANTVTTQNQTDDSNQQEKTGLTRFLAEKFVKPEGAYLPINAFFSPVTRVNYTVETRINDENQKSELIHFEIWTNGSVDPRHAIHLGIKAVIKLLLPLQQRTAFFEPTPHKQPLPPSLLRRQKEQKRGEKAYKKTTTMARKLIQLQSQFIQKQQHFIKRQRKFIELQDQIPKKKKVDLT